MAINYKPGTKVRSYDFPGRTDCYIDGTVIASDDSVYEIRVERRVVNDLEVDSQLIGGSVFPPLNGCPKLFGGVTDGVEAKDALRLRQAVASEVDRERFDD